MGNWRSGGGLKKNKNPTFAPDRDPWEQQPGERDNQYRGFISYRDLGGERSLLKNVAVSGISNTTLQKWNSQWHWRVRVEAWDRMLYKEQQAEDVKAVRDMRKRHLQLSMGMQRLATLELKRLIDDAEVKSTENRLTARDVTKLVETATKVERLNRGLPDTITHTALTGQDGGPVQVENSKEKLQGLLDRLAALKK